MEGKCVVKLGKCFCKYKLVKLVTTHQQFLSVATSHIGVAHDIFGLDPLDMLNSFVRGLKVDVASDVLLSGGVALYAVAPDLLRRHRMILDDAFIRELVRVRYHPPNMESKREARNCSARRASSGDGA